MSQQDFLVELGTEELPPKALPTLGKALQDELLQSLKGHDLQFEAAEWFATPRRLAVLVHQLSDKAPDQQVEVIGPPAAIAFDDAGEPTKAALAFAKKNAIEVSALKVDDTPKGPRLVHRFLAPGVEAAAVLPGLVEAALEQLPIPKRMHWGKRKDLFVRPVHWLLLLQGKQVLTHTMYGVNSGKTTQGHRFHSKGELVIESPAHYAECLQQQGQVIASFDQRRAQIRQQVEAQAQQLGATAVISNALLDEVTALVEWPVALSGSFDGRFLAVPPEALISSMREHQKYFHVIDDDGQLLPRFIFVANIESKAPEQVIQGNEKVIRPRLADAAFFYETDLKSSLESRCERLKSIVFQDKLGTVWDKSQRVAGLSRFIAEKMQGNSDHAERAALLAKTDLVSEMVLEFDDLQGIAGYYYALHDGEAHEVALAMKEQYLPRYAGDDVPTSATGCAVALADRIDTLVGIFGIGQVPSGSKDPFALRRAALGVIRIIREKQLDSLDLNLLLGRAVDSYGSILSNENTAQDVANFIFDRYRAMYRDEGVATNTVLAALAVLQSDNSLPHNPYDIALRVEAVEAFSTLAEAEALAAASKRVQNILAKQAQQEGGAEVDPGLFKSPQESTLHQQLQAMATRVPAMCQQQHYREALLELATLRDATDAFFDHVMVMDEDPALRANRIGLLAELNQLFIGIADISQLQNKASS